MIKFESLQVCPICNHELDCDYVNQTSSILINCDKCIIKNYYKFYIKLNNYHAKNFSNSNVKVIFIIFERNEIFYRFEIKLNNLTISKLIDDYFDPMIEIKNYEFDYPINLFFKLIQDEFERIIKLENFQ